MKEQDDRDNNIETMNEDLLRVSHWMAKGDVRNEDTFSGSRQVLINKNSKQKLLSLTKYRYKNMLLEMKVTKRSTIVLVANRNKKYILFQF